MKRLTLATAAAAAALVSLAALAQVPSAPPAPEQARLTLAQAVVIAETMGQGRALKAKLDERDDQPVYKVTVKDSLKEPLEVTLAAYGGAIVASEREDHDD
jgi:uncharacterized membrane protein YkoI